MKMAELQVCDAPLAIFDEEFVDFDDFQIAADIENSNKVTNMATERNAPSVVDNFNDSEFNDVNFSGSLEDLVNTFDEKITKCFCNYKENVEKFAPVQVRSQEEIMNDCQMWWTITGNFGNILPIDWSKSYSRQLHTKSLKLGEKRECESPDLDLSDDEELQQAFDMHSLIINSLHHEPVFTADQVINEIEGMMDEEMGSESCSTPNGSDMLSVAECELLNFGKDGQTTLTSLPDDYEEGLKSLTRSALNELQEELEVTIKEYSETLIHQLALRDELEYEKELKNQFISLLLSIQKKRREADKRRGGLGNVIGPKRQRSAGPPEPGTYLTTVIPYHANQGPPTIDQLQIYIKILRAINDDSPSVPGLLTDYILKVLCPTT